ncbi:MAG: carbohydrate ABC transporter permease [Candidatus Omnitrophica bacterium]|nr:carbohydrate ABC transporter permease [Candidatus Omnitrophota bacterium]
MEFNKHQLKHATKYAGIHFFLIMAALISLFPLLWMVRSSLMTMGTIFTDKSIFPSQFHLENYYTAWTQGHFATYFLNSVFYTLTSVFLIVLISSLAAYAFSRLEFPGRNIFFYMFVAAMMIPLPGSFVPLVVLVNKLGLADTRIGYVLCMVNVGLAISIILLKTFFDKMPSDLEDMARIDGCSKLGIWWHIAMPLARPAIAVVVIFNALNVWNEFILAQLLLSSRELMPLQKGLMEFQGVHGVNYPVLMAGVTIAAVPIIIVYLLMQKHIIKGLTSGAIVG